MQRALLLPQEKNEYFIKLNVDGLLRGDYQSRMTGYSIGRQNGWLLTNDIREMEDMNLVSAEEGGHLYLINGNMTKLKDAGFLCMQGYGQVLIFVDKVANTWYSNIRKWQNKLVKKLKLLKK